MDQGFHNKQDWRTVALALSIWAAHFTAVWAASIIFPGQPLAYWLSISFSLAAFAALFLAWSHAGRPGLFSAAGLTLAIAVLGTIFDAMPALIV